MPRLGSFPATDPSAKVSPPPPSLYETWWDEYSDLWDSLDGFRAYAHLGDEWGPEAHVEHVIERFAAPYLARDARTLEIGPGGGRYTHHLLAHCGEVIGVDCSSKMLARVRTRFPDIGRARFVKNDGHGIPMLPAASFDFACAFNVFVQFALEDVHGYLLELHRLLVPGGVATIHYADLSHAEGWRHFESHREEWAHAPCGRGRFPMLTAATMDLLAWRAGFGVLRNQPVGRDSIAVLRKPRTGESADTPRSRPDEARPDFTRVEKHLEDLSADVYDERPTDHHTAAAHDAIDRLVAPLGVRSAVELGCGAAPSLDRLAALGVRTLGVTLGDEPCGHEVLRADIHRTGLDDGSFDLVVARHVVEHSPMPLVLLLEMHRITKTYALVVVPCDEEIWIRWPNHYSVLSKAMWKRLFERARFKVLAEEDGPLEPASTEWRFLLEKESHAP